MSSSAMTAETFGFDAANKQQFLIPSTAAMLSIKDENHNSDDDDDTLNQATKQVKSMMDHERNFALTPCNLTAGVLTPSPSNASGRVTASPLRVSQSQVTCSSCLKQFDRCERRPKLLDCIHTVCSVCLEDYNAKNPAPSLPGSIGQEQVQQTSCPLCQRLTPTAVEKLPLDVVTLAMSENLTLFSRRNCFNCDATSEQIGDHPGTTLHWDSVCGILTCQACYEEHIRDAAPYSHKPGSLVAVPARISDDFYRQIRDMRNAPCPLHSSEMLNQYCFECNAFVCPDCVASHQRHHLVREQLDFAQQFGVESDFYRIYIDNLKPFLRNLDQMWPILRDRASQLDHFADGYESNAKEMFSHIMQRLDEFKQHTFESVQRIREERECQLRQDEERLAGLILTGDRLIQWMMQSLDFCNTVELAAARQFVTSAYQQLFSSLDSFSRQSQGPADAVQLPRIELFESTMLNILQQAENQVHQYQMSHVPNAPESPAREHDEHLLLGHPARRHNQFAHAGANGTPAVSVIPQHKYQLQQEQAQVPFGHHQSLMPGGHGLFGSSHHQNDASPAPLTPSAAAVTGSTNAPQNVSFLHGMLMQQSPVHNTTTTTSQNHGPSAMLLREPAQRIPRQRMIYHLKFGEFGVMEGQFTEPSGIACNAQNDIIVADTNNHRVQIFDSEGRFKFTYGECGKRDAQLLYPNRVAVCKSTGDIVVTERSPSHQVQIYDQYGIFVRRFGQDSLKHPRGVFVDSRGRILVVECKVMRVTIFSMEGRVLKSFTCRSYLEFPNGICATDNPEEIYISDNRAHCVWVFNYDGIFLRRIGGEGITNYPIGVGINQLGEIIVADNHNNFNLTAFTPEGQVLYGLESKVKHAQVFDSTLMNDGCVAIACKDYRVYVYRYMSASTRHLGLNIR